MSKPTENTKKYIQCERCGAYCNNENQLVQVSVGPDFTYSSFVAKCCQHLGKEKSKTCYIKNQNVKQNVKQNVNTETSKESENIHSDITVEKWLDSAKELIEELNKNK